MPNDLKIADCFNMKYGDDPYWNESSWFSWHIPEKNINGLFYYFFRPNMRCLNGGVGMWDLTGQHTWDCLYWDWQYMRELPKGKYGVDYNKYDFVAPCSLGVRTLEPLKRYHLTYDRNGFKVDLIWEGIADIHPLPVLHEGKTGDAYAFHFEQPGRVKGHVELHGERYAVDSYAIRDGSHGRRSWGDVPTGGYTWSTASERSAWHFIAVDKDSTHDTKIMGGYYLRDGVMSSLVSGVRRVVERRGPRAEILEVQAKDELGRELQAVGRLTVPGFFHAYSDQVYWWNQFLWDYDGHTGAIGEDQEYYPVEAMRRWLRANPSRWKTR